MEKPIFIFSAGWRSGSTMLQRLITASGEVLVWGEAGGALNHLADALECYRQMLGEGGVRYKFGFGGYGEQQYQKFKDLDRHGVHEWIACMNPPLHHHLGAFRAFLDSIYAGPAADMGYQRWGVKEVQSGIDTVKFIQEIYPDSKIVFLVRNPVDCILSIKRRGWMDKAGDPMALEYYVNHWKWLANEFHDSTAGYTVKYEDLVNDPQSLAVLSEYLDVKSLSLEFTANSHADWQAHNQQQLTIFERRRLLNLAGDAMEKYGYR